MSSELKFAVLGAGNGGHAFIAEFWARGFNTNWFDFPQFKEAILPVQEKGGIEVVSSTDDAKRGKGTYFVEINGKVTTDIEEAIKDVDLIMIVVPAYAHRPFAELCAPYLEENQIVVLNPGDTCGAIEFSKIIKENGCKKRVTVAETVTLLFATRAGVNGGLQPGQVAIKSLKKEMPVGAIPAHDIDRVIKILKEAFPQFTPAKNIFETSLNRPAIVFHPTSVLLNVSKIEQTPSYKCKAYDVTPSLGKVMDAIDGERLEIQKALGIEQTSTPDMLHKFYGAKGENMYEVLTDCYKGESTAPPNLQYRYVTEDVPYMLVPISSLGDLLGVETPTIKALIQIASVINQTDYLREGRTVEKLGFAGMNAEEIMRSVTEGT